MKLILCLLLLTSCAPMPNRKFQIPNNIKVIEHTSIETTSAICNNLFLKYHEYSQIFLGCLLNFCIIPACYEMREQECEIWVMHEIFLPHERKHCEGYKDQLY